MKRVVLRLLLLAFIATSLWLLAQRYNGSVIINWLGYEVAIGMDAALPIIMFIVVFLVEMDRAWLWFAGIPRRFVAKRKEKKSLKGAQLIMQGLSAIAAADSVMAKKISRQSLQMIKGETPEFHSMATLLAAQTAELEGNDEVAAGYYRGMLDGPARFLAMAGLLKIYIRAIPENKPETRDKIGEAINMAERALRIQPNSAWLTAELADLYVRYGEFKQAITLLERARKKSVMAEDEAKEKLAVAYNRCAADNADSNRAIALMYAEKAVDVMPSYSPAVIMLANIHQKSGRNDSALKTIEKFWRNAASQALTERYLRLTSDMEAEKRLKRVRKMTADNPSAMESLIILAQASSDAGDYISARKHLKDALRIDPESSRLKRIMADMDKRTV